jgi:hypothetical protein
MKGDLQARTTVIHSRRCFGCGKDPDLATHQEAEDNLPG